MFYNNAATKTAAVLRGNKVLSGDDKKVHIFSIKTGKQARVDSRQGRRGSFDTISALVKIRKSVVHVAPTLSHLNMRSRINSNSRCCKQLCLICSRTNRVSFFFRLIRFTFYLRISGNNANVTWFDYMTT